MKFSTLTFAAAALTIASFAHAADESTFAPQPMSMKSRAEVRAEAVGTSVRGDVGRSYFYNLPQTGMSTLTRDEVRAMAGSNDSLRVRLTTPTALDQVGGM